MSEVRVWSLVVISLTGQRFSTRPHVSGDFWIRNFNLFGCGFRPYVSVESCVRIGNFFWICSPERKSFNTLRIRNRVDAKSKYSFIRRRNKIDPSSLPQTLYSRWQPHSQVLSRQGKMQILRALRHMLYCEVLGTSKVPEWIAIRVGSLKFFHPLRKGKVANSKISGYVCGRGQSVLKMAATVYERDFWFGD